MCSLSAGALCREAFKTRGLSALSKGNGGWGEGHKAGLIQRQPYSANAVGFEVGLQDLCFPKMFFLLYGISLLGIGSFGLKSY